MSENNDEKLRSDDERVLVKNFNDNNNTGRASSSTNYVELYINYMLEKYGNGVFVNQTVKNATEVTCLNKYDEYDSLNKECESPVPSFLGETQLHDLNLTQNYVTQLFHKDTSQEAQTATTVTTVMNERDIKKATPTVVPTMVTTTTNTNTENKNNLQPSSSSKFVLHTPLEMEKKMEEQAQWTGKRGRGRPRKKIVDNKTIKKKNKTNY
ncbi:hypothetical protein ABK040_007936 [Willaertia magna]